MKCFSSCKMRNFTLFLTPDLMQYNYLSILIIKFNGKILQLDKDMKFCFKDITPFLNSAVVNLSLRIAKSVVV